MGEAACGSARSAGGRAPLRTRPSQRLGRLLALLQRQELHRRVGHGEQQAGHRAAPQALRGGQGGACGDRRAATEIASLTSGRTAGDTHLDALLPHDGPEGIGEACVVGGAGARSRGQGCSPDGFHLYLEPDFDDIQRPYNQASHATRQGTRQRVECGFPRRRLFGRGNMHASSAVGAPTDGRQARRGVFDRSRGAPGCRPAGGRDRPTMARPPLLVPYVKLACKAVRRGSRRSVNSLLNALIAPVAAHTRVRHPLQLLRCGCGAASRGIGAIPGPPTASRPACTSGRLQASCRVFKPISHWCMQRARLTQCAAALLPL